MYVKDIKMKQMSVGLRGVECFRRSMQACELHSTYTQAQTTYRFSILVNKPIE